LRQTSISKKKMFDISRRSFLGSSVAFAAFWALPSFAIVKNFTRYKAGKMQDGPLAMTNELTEFIVGMKNEDIPPEMYEHAKVALLDLTGAMLAGKDEPVTKRLLQMAQYSGGKQQSTIIGHGTKMSVLQAALINGAAAHALDFDDSSDRFWGHPSCSIFTSLLALGEAEGKSGTDILSAYLIGLQVGMVTADSVGEEMYRAGFHCTSSIGIIASGAACARLLNLDSKQTSNALAIATTQSFGLKRSFGTDCKPFHSGQAAQGAVTAALLAREGFTGAEDILEGPNGLLQVFGGKVNDFALGTLASNWSVKDLSTKYHASCHWTHSPIEAALLIKNENKLVAEDIKSIEIICSEIALGTADVKQPQVGLQGKFSIPYCVANALVTGNTGLPAFTDEAVNSQEIKSLIENTTVHAHPKAENFEARVTIMTNGGDRYSRDINVMEQTLSLDEKRTRVKEKYTGIAAPILGKSKTDRLADAILDLDKMDNVKELMNQLSG